MTISSGRCFRLCETLVHIDIDDIHRNTSMSVTLFGSISTSDIWMRQKISIECYQNTPAKLSFLPCSRARSMK